MTRGFWNAEQGPLRGRGQSGNELKTSIEPRSSEGGAREKGGTKNIQHELLEEVPV